jgi:hypothetical protein
MESDHQLVTKNLEMNLVLRVSVIAIMGEGGPGMEESKSREDQIGLQLTAVDGR